MVSTGNNRRWKNRGFAGHHPLSIVRGSTFRALALALTLPLLGGNGGPLLLGHLLDIFDHTCGCPISGREHECQCRQCLLARTHAKARKQHRHGHEGNDVHHAHHAEQTPAQDSESSHDGSPCHEGDDVDSEDAIVRRHIHESEKEHIGAGKGSDDSVTAIDSDENRSSGNQHLAQLGPAPCATAMGDGLLLSLPLIALSEPAETGVIPFRPLTLPEHHDFPHDLISLVPSPPPRS